MFPNNMNECKLPHEAKKLCKIKGTPFSGALKRLLEKRFFYSYVSSDRPEGESVKPGNSCNRHPAEESILFCQQIAGSVLGGAIESIHYVACLLMLISLPCNTLARHRNYKRLSLYKFLEFFENLIIGSIPA